METIKGNFKYINTGRTVKLSSLIKCSDITDKSIIQIYDAEGKFITKGNWYQDNVLGWSDHFGKASKAGTGLTVKFQLT